MTRLIEGVDPEVHRMALEQVDATRAALDKLVAQHEAKSARLAEVIEENGRLRNAGEKLNAIIERIQEATAKYLPGVIGYGALIDQVLQLTDGPEQRQAQGEWTALTKPAATSGAALSEDQQVKRIADLKWDLDEAKHNVSVLHDCAADRPHVHTMMKHEQACAVDRINALRADNERMERMVLRLWHEEVLSEGQAMQALGVDRVSARARLDEYLSEPPAGLSAAMGVKCGGVLDLRESPPVDPTDAAKVLPPRYDDVFFAGTAALNAEAAGAVQAPPSDPSWEEVVRCVDAFRLVMLEKLAANRAKKGCREGWKNDNPRALLARVRQETAELDCVTRWITPRKDLAKLLREAADVANMAMMVADAAGALEVPVPWPTHVAEEVDRRFRAGRKAREFMSEPTPPPAPSGSVVRQVAEAKAETATWPAWKREAHGLEAVPSGAVELTEEAKSILKLVASIPPRDCPWGCEKGHDSHCPADRALSIITGRSTK